MIFIHRALARTESDQHGGDEIRGAEREQALVLAEMNVANFSAAQIIRVAVDIAGAVVAVAVS